MLSRIGTLIYTKLCGALVGIDEFGNRYYTSKAGRRWVVYSGVGDASKVSPRWHGWLHFSCDVLEKKVNFQKEYVPNTTGTINCYRKKDSVDCIAPQSLHAYTAWQPK